MMRAAFEDDLHAHDRITLEQSHFQGIAASLFASRNELRGNRTANNAILIEAMRLLGFKISAISDESFIVQRSFS
jgi:hypothetical protein